MSKYVDAHNVLAKRNFIMMLVVMPYIIVLAITLMNGPGILEAKGYTLSEINIILRNFLIGVAVVYAGLIGLGYYILKKKYII